MQLSFITTYYNQHEMLQKQIALWESYSDEIKEQVQFVVVDDGSEKLPIDVLLFPVVVTSPALDPIPVL